MSLLLPPSLRDALAHEAPDAATLARAFDDLTYEGRVAATRSLPRRDFARLFAAAAMSPLPALDELVPADSPPFEAVRYVGVNNMPLFRTFEKPLYRDDEGRIRGRNVQTWQAFTGPRYFSVVAAPAAAAAAATAPVTPSESTSAIVFDYTELPRKAPPGWPRITSNSRGLSRFVFGDLADNVRRLAQDVVIGHATRHAKDLPQYFLLVRAPV